MIVFEDLVDDLRSGDIDEAGKRQLSMVLESQRGARMDLAMLDLFDEARELEDQDFDVADLVDRTLAQLDEGRPSAAAPKPERMPFDPIPAPAPLPEDAPASKPRVDIDATRAALGKPRWSKRPLTTTQKLAVQLERRPFLRPWLAAAVVLLSLSMGWTARGLLSGEADPVLAPPAKAPVAEAEPETRTLGSDDLLAFAENAASRDQFRRAARLYQELLRRFPRSAEAPMAQLGLARLQLEDLQDPVAAAESYGAFLEANPTDDLAPDAALGRARALDAAGSAEAATAWRAIEERYPESDAARLGRRQR